MLGNTYCLAYCGNILCCISKYNATVSSFTTPRTIPVTVCSNINTKKLILHWNKIKDPDIVALLRYAFFYLNTMTATDGKCNHRNLSVHTCSEWWWWLSGCGTLTMLVEGANLPTGHRCLSHLHLLWLTETKQQVQLKQVFLLENRAQYLYEQSVSVTVQLCLVYLVTYKVNTEKQYHLSLV